MDLFYPILGNAVCMWLVVSVLSFCELTTFYLMVCQWESLCGLPCGSFSLFPSDADDDADIDAHDDMCTWVICHCNNKQSGSSSLFPRMSGQYVCLLDRSMAAYHCNYRACRCVCLHVRSWYFAYNPIMMTLMTCWCRLPSSCWQNCGFSASKQLLHHTCTETQPIITDWMTVFL